MSSKKPVGPKSRASMTNIGAASNPDEEPRSGKSAPLSTARSRARQQQGIVSVRNQPCRARPGEDEAIVPPKEADDVLHLLDEWLADESGYEEESWPRLREALDQDRLSDRPLFKD